ncbi:Transposon Ty3-G Gag-Pol poly, partial [Paramuricea clavata]
PSITWHFEHITSSPGYPQSNGGAERTVQIAKSLMTKAVEGVDPYLSLLNHRNTPRDSVLGSPAQRLMSRQTKSLLLMAKKSCYSQKAQELPILNQGDVVRIQGEKGFMQKGVVVEKSQHPRSYLVKSSSKTYRRNRKHLLKVDEPIEKHNVEKVDYGGEEDNQKKNANEQLHSETQAVVSSPNNDGNSSVKTYNL